MKAQTTFFSSSLQSKQRWPTVCVFQDSVCLSLTFCICLCVYHRQYVYCNRQSVFFTVYPHWSRDLVSPVSGIFFQVFKNKRMDNILHLITLPVMSIVQSPFNGIHTGLLSERRPVWIPMVPIRVPWVSQHPTMQAAIWHSDVRLSYGPESQKKFIYILNF